MEKLVYVDRRNTNCNKWDGQQKMFGEEGLHAMWVADMDFRVPECVVSALREYVESGVYGYYKIPDAYYQAFIDWEREHHGYEVKKEWIRFSPGVVAGFHWLLQILTEENDAVIVNTPVYYPFLDAVKNNHRNLICSDLKNENGEYSIDFDDFEKKITDHQVKLFILCSPHNPAGRVWKKEEIQKFMDICKKHDVLVFSDEIWSDLVRKENTHIPTQSISEDAKKRTIAGYAPSKTFNLAGLVGSYHIVYDKYLRDRLNKQASLSHYNSPNILSVHALMGAYCKEGLDWVNELNEVISNNIDYALDFIHNNFKGIEVIKPEGTYMLYLDCTKYLDTHDITMDELLKKGVHYGVCWQDGRPFMNPNTIRMNLALPTILVEEAFSRLKKFVF